MKTKGACFFALILGCCVVQAAEDASVKKAVKQKVEVLTKATIDGDFAKVTDLTHPKVVELLGGREKMISVMESGIKDMKSKGYSFRSAKVDAPSDLVAAGSDVFVVVPFLLEMKVPGGRLLQKSFVIGVSGDQGKSWVFVNGDLDIKRVKQVLPNLPDQLKLPERRKPVLEKE